MTIRIRESGGKLEKNGSEWEVLFITEGKGSSGFYSGEMLQQYGPTAWPKGTQIFLDHLTESDWWERGGNHSIKDLAGVFITDPEWVEESRGLRAKIQVFSNHAQFVQEAFEHIGLSVESQVATKDDDGNITSIAPSPLNAVSIVPRAGRGGKFVELAEKFVHVVEKSKPTAIIENDDKDSKGVIVNDEDLKKIVEGVTTAVTSALSPILEGLKPAPAEPTEKPDVAEVAEKVIEAKLPPAARKRVFAAVAEGTAVKDAIEAETTVMEEYRKAFEAEQEAVVEGRVNLAEGKKSQTLDDIFEGGI